MTANTSRKTVVSGAAALVFLAGCVAWVFPIQTAAAAGNWALPSLSVAALAVALVLAADWPWLRGFVVVLAATLVLGWTKVPGSSTAASHFAGASLGLLLMFLVGRIAATQQGLRLATLAFLSGGLAVLAAGFVGTNLLVLMNLASGLDLRTAAPYLATRLPAVRLGLVGMGPTGYVNPNALAAVVLLVAPLGASVLFLKNREKVDLRGLRPLGFASVVVGTSILAVSRSRTAWMATLLTVVVLLARGGRSWASRLLMSTLLVAPPFAIAGGAYWTSRERFLEYADNLWRNVHERADVLMSGVERWKESPWLGIGLNHFRHVYNPGAAPEFDVAHAHNVFLQTALDVGVFGLAAYCGVLGYLLIRADQTARGPSSLGRAVAIGSALSLVAVSMFGLTDAVALGAKIGSLQWMAAGLILAAWRIRSETNETTRARR